MGAQHMLSLTHRVNEFTTSFSAAQPERPVAEFPNLQDVTQVTVLRRAEWDRIQFQLRKRQVLEEERRKRIAAKERLHEQSQDRAKGWGNTIQVCLGIEEIHY